MLANIIDTAISYSSVDVSRSCYCSEVLAVVMACIVQIVCYITLGCFFPIRSPINLQSEDLSHGSQLWMRYRK